MTPAGIENLVYAALFFVLIGLGFVAYLCWVFKDTSTMSPEYAVTHRENVIKVEKGIAITNVALAVVNQAVNHAGRAKPTAASHIEVPANGLASYAWSRHVERQKDHVERQKDIADGMNRPCRLTSCTRREWQPRSHSGSRRTITAPTRQRGLAAAEVTDLGTAPSVKYGRRVSETVPSRLMAVAGRLPPVRPNTRGAALISLPCPTRQLLQSTLPLSVELASCVCAPLQVHPLP